MKNKLRSYGEHKASGKELLVFHCPGCKYDHAVNVKGRPDYHPQVIVITNYVVKPWRYLSMKTGSKVAPWGSVPTLRVKVNGGL